MDESKSDKKDTQKTYYEDAKCTHCATHAKTNEEVEIKFSFKGDGEIYRRCNKCMNIFCWWKENKEKQRGYKKKHYEQNKRKIM